jgi:hypothetical protein
LEGNVYGQGACLLNDHLYCHVDLLFSSGELRSFREWLELLQSIISTATMSMILNKYEGPNARHHPRPVAMNDEKFANWACAVHAAVKCGFDHTTR